MIEREKVLSGLHCRGQDLVIDPPACDGCRYHVQFANRIIGCDFRQLCRDAIDLLKEQEAVVPLTIDDAVSEIMDKHYKRMKEQEAKIPSIMQDVEGIWATCPTCGNKLRAILAMEMDTYFPKYCQECGQAVKWDA